MKYGPLPFFEYFKNLSEYCWNTILPLPRGGHFLHAFHFSKCSPLIFSIFTRDTRWVFGEKDLIIIIISDWFLCWVKPLNQGVPHVICLMRQCLTRVLPQEATYFQIAQPPGALPYTFPSFLYFHFFSVIICYLVIMFVKITLMTH
jgi:hypothetical protein